MVAAAKAEEERWNKAAEGKKKARRVSPEIQGSSPVTGGGGEEEMAEPEAVDLDTPGREFTGKLLTHKLLKHNCRNNDTVVTVCRRLKMTPRIKET